MKCSNHVHVLTLSIVLCQEIVGKLAALEETDAPATIKPCSLDMSTQDLVKLIFNNDMFKEAMQSMEIGEAIGWERSEVVNHSL